MNKLNLNGARNFPLTTNALKFMQEAYERLEELAGLGGENYILSGCTVAGSAAGNGFVVLNGMLMPFVGGTIQANIKIVETSAVIVVDTGTRTEVTYNAEFGTSTTPGYTFSWAAVNSNRISARTKEKIIEIGDWNMDTTNIKDFTFASIGISGKDKILTVDVVVFTDDDQTDLNINSDLKRGGFIEWGTVYEANPLLNNSIRLSRNAGGIFDSGYYDKTNFNRGKMVIKYIE